MQYFATPNFGMLYYTSLCLCYSAIYCVTLLDGITSKPTTRLRMHSVAAGTRSHLTARHGKQSRGIRFRLETLADVACKLLPHMAVLGTCKRDLNSKRAGITVADAHGTEASIALPGISGEMACSVRPGNMYCYKTVHRNQHEHNKCIESYERNKSTNADMNINLYIDE